jgi:sulfonate transport system substrate-binding protein
MSSTGLSRRAAVAALAVAPFAAFAARAAAPGDKPAPLATPVKLTLGINKAAHLAPLIDLTSTLAGLGVEVTMAEFGRYADSRTALASGSVEIASMASADLPLVLSQGVTSVVGLMGVASSPKNPIVRNGITCDTWQDLMKLRLGVPPGGAVWYQFIARIQELGFKYDQFQTVNIQGAGINFAQALQRGDIDAYINSEPTDSMPELGGYGKPASKIDYSESKAVGAELGLVAASKDALKNKPEAVRRFVWAYLTAQAEMAVDRERYALGIQRWCGLEAGMSRTIAGKIRLGGVLDVPQLVRLATFMKQVDIIQRDVTADLPSYFDLSIVQSVTRA